MSVHKKRNLGADRLLREILEIQKRYVRLPIMARLVMDLQAWTESKVEGSRYGDDERGTAEDLQTEDEAVWL